MFVPFRPSRIHSFLVLTKLISCRLTLQFNDVFTVDVFRKYECKLPLYCTAVFTLSAFNVVDNAIEIVAATVACAALVAVIAVVLVVICQQKR